MARDGTQTAHQYDLWAMWVTVAEACRETQWSPGSVRDDVTVAQFEIARRTANMLNVAWKLGQEDVE